jgi:demethylmenaquinone methyltransferase/2-methoxy-6-polyprenyl-1,4-benzoquinol methylase
MDITRSRRQPNEFARQLFAPLPARYDRLAAILSLGQNGRWRAEMVSHVAASSPAMVLDVATGPAGVACLLARRAAADVVGIDVSHEMLHEGVANVARAGLTDRVSLLVGKGEQLPFPDACFDALTFTYLLRYVADPAATLAELARVVKPGGSIASMEFAVPTAPWWHAAWWGYTRAVLPVAGLLTGGRGWYRVGRFLGPSISSHYRQYPVDWTVQAWEAAGVHHVETRTMSLAGGLVMWGTRAP